jgi:exopolyphosphatase/guanosine-5'-triphosphate,3'-diphosphate pyrophosphatase
LHIACILHETGHYANSDDAQEASFNLVKNAHIYGLCSKDTLLAANIIAPQSLLGVTRGISRGSMLDGEDVLFTAKMHALLHLSDALDYSQKQKAKLYNFNLEPDSLTVSVQIREDFTLERWIFKESALLFQEIFGITPKLKISNIYNNNGGEK